MRFVAWKEKNGPRKGLALRRGEDLLDLGDVKLLDLIAEGDAGFGRAQLLASNADQLDPAAIEHRVPLDTPPKIICIGYNYADHVVETGHVAKEPGPDEYLPFFPRFASTLVPHGGAIVRPIQSHMLDYEGEMLVVIGKPGRHVSRADALDYVVGFSVFNDVSVRDVQRNAPQWTQGKNFDKTGAFGPEFVTADEVPPGGAGLRIQTWLNGNLMQSASTSQLIWDVSHVIEKLSGFTTLEPGTLIATGTPSGVGSARKPPVWMKHGDVVEVDVEGIGRLRNTVEDECIRG